MPQIVNRTCVRMHTILYQSIKKIDRTINRLRELMEFLSWSPSSHVAGGDNTQSKCEDSPQWIARYRVR